MAKSMTGFGRAEAEGNGFQVVCEIKSVNHRYLDLSFRLSRRYTCLEERIRDTVRQYVVRGRVEVYLNVDRKEERSRNIKVDNLLALAYYNSLKDLANYLSLSPDFTVIDLFRLPEVFSVEEEEEDVELVWQIMEDVLVKALGSLDEMRRREGQALVGDILSRNRRVREMVDELEERAPQVIVEYRDKLRKRINELCDGIEIDENRLAGEIAFFADRASVAEEIVRLRSHCEQMEMLLAADESVGRKSDFLIQEMMREINTIAAKGNDLKISRLAVEVKAELEKMREQVQNLE